MPAVATLPERFSSLSDLKELAQEIWPLALTCVVIMVVGAVAGWLLGWCAKRLFIAIALRRVSPDGPEDSTFKDVVSRKGAGDFVARGVFWLVILVTLTVAAEFIGLSIVKVWTEAVVSYAPRVVLALVIAVAGVIGGRIAGDVVARLTRRVSQRQAERIATVVSWTVYVLAILVAAAQLGLDVSFITTIMLVVLGVTLSGLALAFGLGAREMVTDILAVHYADQAYQSGQVVRVGEIEGRVLRTTATSVVLDTETGEVSVPGRVFAREPCRTLREASDGEP